MADEERGGLDRQKRKILAIHHLHLLAVHQPLRDLIALIVHGEVALRAAGGAGRTRATLDGPGRSRRRSQHVEATGDVHVFPDALEIGLERLDEGAAVREVWGIV